MENKETRMWGEGYSKWKKKASKSHIEKCQLKNNEKYLTYETNVWKGNSLDVWKEVFPRSPFK